MRNQHNKRDPARVFLFHEERGWWDVWRRIRPQAGRCRRENCRPPAAGLRADAENARRAGAGSPVRYMSAQSPASDSYTLEWRDLPKGAFKTSRFEHDFARAKSCRVK